MVPELPWRFPSVPRMHDVRGLTAHPTGTDPRRQPLSRRSRGFFSDFLDFGKRHDEASPDREHRFSVLERTAIGGSTAVGFDRDGDVEGGELFHIKLGPLLVTDQQERHPGFMDLDRLEDRLLGLQPPGSKSQPRAANRWPARSRWPRAAETSRKTDEAKELWRTSGPFHLRGSRSGRSRLIARPRRVFDEGAAAWRWSFSV